MTEQKQHPWFWNFPQETPPVWSMFGSFATGSEPMARSAARTNLELSSLAGKRMQAYMALPEVLSRCRSPFDVMQAQMAFWQVAGRQYSETSRHVLEAWQGAFAGAHGGEGTVQPRDYITFPEARPETEPDERRQGGGTRRAA